MSPESSPTEHRTDRVCPSLRSAREKLCVAQTDVASAAHREMLQDALDNIDRVGVFVCPDWSRFDEPTITGEPSDES